MGSSSLLVLWLYFLIVHSPICIRSNAEVDALYAFKKGLSDPNHVLQSWDNSLVNPCSWTHVTCNANNHVTSIDLGASELAGPLVSNLGLLSWDRGLVNPCTWSHVTCEGDQPSVTRVNLGNYKLKGPLVRKLGVLTSLSGLYLNGNGLTGQIPNEFKKLTNLQFLMLNDNQLTGKLPWGYYVSLKSVFPSIISANLSNNPLYCPCPGGCPCHWNYP